MLLKFPGSLGYQHSLLCRSWGCGEREREGSSLGNAYRFPSRTSPGGRGDNPGMKMHDTEDFMAGARDSAG